MDGELRMDPSKKGVYSYILGNCCSKLSSGNNKVKNVMAFETLILGAGRGGTSLLTSLLDYHPQLTVYQELGAYHILMGKHPDYQGMTVQGRIEEFDRLCTGMAARFQNTLFGNKVTTEQIRGMHEEFIGYFKDKRFIFILRDGRTCVRSKIQRRNVPEDKAVAAWKFSVDVLRLVSEQPNAIVIKFEDLIKDTEDMLAGVCEFLDVRYDPVMLNGTGHAAIRSEYRRKPGDLDKSVTSLDHPICRSVERHIMAELKEFGYHTHDSE